jgi:hypothetical protein
MEEAWMKSKNVIATWGGPPCPRCDRPMQIREHECITDKLRQKPCFYSRWYCCMHLDCKTTTVMPPEYKVLNPTLFAYDG